jgi:thiamine pyrophosphate-dependent acetolactate synthase large subunit-like protein
LKPYRGVATGLRGQWLLLQDDLREGIPLLKKALEELHAHHHEMLNMDFLCDLGAGLAAQTEAQVADRLTAVAGSCGPGSLHFINGIFEANRNRAPVILIASQIIRDELGVDFIQEVDFKQVYRDCSVFCDMIHTPEQARRKTVIACQTALAKRGVAALIVPADSYITSGVGMQNSLWSEALADCISP